MGVRLIKFRVNSRVFWRTNPDSNFTYKVHADNLVLVNPAYYEVLDQGSDGREGSALPVVGASDVIFSETKLFFVVQGGHLPDLSNESSIEKYQSLISSFLLWLKALTFQHQISPVPSIVAISAGEYEVGENLSLPQYGDYSKMAIRKYVIDGCATEQLAVEAMAMALSGKKYRMHLQFLIDAINAFELQDYRQSVLYLAIAAESVAAETLDAWLSARMQGEEGPALRVVEVSVAGGEIQRKDPVYAALSARTDFASLLHERPLYLVGRSLLIERPETYRLARMLYATRNKIVHRGELSDKDVSQCLSLTREDLGKAIDCVVDLFDWFGCPVSLPGQGLVFCNGVSWGRRSAF
jgi:hypothetical protein